MNTDNRIRMTFTPAYTANATKTILAQPDETYFILEQIQPDWSWEKTQEGNLDLVPHRIICFGDYTSVLERYENKERKARYLCKEEEDKWEWMCRGEGDGYINFSVAKGRDIITVTLCTKEVALEQTI